MTGLEHLGLWVLQRWHWAEGLILWFGASGAAGLLIGPCLRKTPEHQIRRPRRDT